MAQTSSLIEQRMQALTARLQQMREMDEWHLFQNFILGLLPHDGYTDVRVSAVRKDFGRDGVAMTPDGKKCVVAVSFDCTLTKIRKDAKRYKEDPNREEAAVLLFAADDTPQNTKVSQWVKKIKDDYGLELRLFNRETILTTATREGVWRETCARLGIPGHRQGYAKVAPYDGELVRRALRARPPEWLRQRVDLPEWEQLTATLRSRLIFGKPGSGKTTTIFEQLERAKPDRVLVVESDLREAGQLEGLLDEAAGGAVIVFDDFHENHKMFVSLCTSLRTRQEDAPRIAQQYGGVSLLAAIRSQEWEKISGEIPDTVLTDLALVGEAKLTVSDLDTGQCRRLIEICRDEWNLDIEDRLLTQAAEAAAERDATPLYVISMLAAARGRDDRTLRDEHLAGLPENVRDLWKRYWDKLDSTSQGVLRLVRLFWAANVPPQPHLLQVAAKSFDIPPFDLAASLDALERSLWLTRTAGVPACLDVQYEVIDLDTAWYDMWNEFVFGLAAGVETRLQLHNGTGVFYCTYVAPRISAGAGYRRRFADAARHFDAVGKLGRGGEQQITVAGALNNASNVCGELAGLETTWEGRKAWLTKAVKAVEESFAIYRELGVRGDLAISLNNVSSRYSALAGLETTREGRRSWLAKAVVAVEESVAIRRELGVRGDLAMSLNNVSTSYGALAGLETTREGRRSWLAKAVEAVEESVAIYRELGVRGDLAMSLNNVSNCYSDLAGLETTGEGHRSWLAKAVEAVEESVAIYRELGVRGDLATSLNNVSVYYSALAGLETTREGRRSWLAKAVEAVEESVAIYRELGVRGDLAMSLGSLCQHRRALADVDGAVDPEEAARCLLLSREAIDEAVTLFRDAGNTPHLLLALQEGVIARLLQAAPGVGVDVEELAARIEEGLELATSMENEQAIEFFTSIKRKLSEGGTEG